MYRDNQGFTLIEVMISAIILFSVLGVSMLAYRTSINTVDRITAHVLIADALPAIMVEVKTALIDHANQGTGHFGKAIAYAWKAKESISSKNILSARDEFTGKIGYGNFTMSLQRIQLTITYVEKDWNKKSRYEYQELSWFR